jgi:uncharacterized membrane protein YoaK (UPF0700 family)
MSTNLSGTGSPGLQSADVLLSRLEERLPPLLSVIAGMVDLTGFLTLGNVFTAHITGNLVVIAALVVRGGRINLTQILAIPVFIVGVAATWMLARTSGWRGLVLLRLLLSVQFLLLAVVFIFSTITKPSAAPHGMMAVIAAMMAVSAMACQFALLRLVWPVAPSTAVMTGNLTNATLSAMNLILRNQVSPPTDVARLKASLRLLIGFFGGCLVAAIAVAYLGDSAWSFPVALAGIATVLR